MNARLPWYKHFPADHLVATADLSLDEEGALARMRDWEWCNGPLPSDPAITAKLIRATRKVAMVAGLLDRYFIKAPDGYIDQNLEAQRHHAEEKRSTLSTSGAAGAAARWGDKPIANASIRASGSGSPGKICTDLGDRTGVEARKLRPVGGEL